jgi:hypothetical protein
MAASSGSAGNLRVSIAAISLIAMVGLAPLIGNAQSTRDRRKNGSTRNEQAQQTPQPTPTPLSLRESTPAASHEEKRDWLRTWNLILGMVSSLLGILVAIRSAPWLKAKVDGYKVSKELGKDFPREDVEKSIEYYIYPFCQDIDPSGAEEPRAVVPVQEKLFNVFDKFISKKTEYAFIIFLADSGMGKTSALIKYYLRQNRFWRRGTGYALKLVALGRQKAIERISETPNKSKTILLLDAFDEDTEAIANHEERLRAILDASQEFPRVLISCRTQFFRRETEIPKETGIMKVGPRPAGASGEYKFHKVYLSAFRDSQIKKYIARRFRFSPFKHKNALEIAAKIPNLACRPMLLAHIDVLVRAKRLNISYSFELYEEMISAWADREDPWVTKENLLEFSDRLAVDLYLKRKLRIPREELTTLATKWNIPLDDWRLSTRSLLNRDADGNYKFAHRSIMEYFLVKRFIKGDDQLMKGQWTDEMHYFLWEMFQYAAEHEKNLNMVSGWPRCSESQGARNRLLASAVLIGLQRINASINPSEYDNISKIVVLLCSWMLSTEKLSDTRVTLLNASRLAEHHKYEVVYSRRLRAIDDLPFQDWQNETISRRRSAAR